MKESALATKDENQVHESGLTGRVVKALGHPLRVQALQILNLRTASPNELASEMDVGVSLLSYHIRVLSELECIELVRTEPVRGAVEHFYRATSRALISQEEWGQVPESVRGSISGALWGHVVPVVNRALKDGSFDRREDRHFSWSPMIVDRQGWEEVRAILDEDLSRLFEIQAESGERLADGGGERISMSALLSCFEVEPSKPDADPRKE
jgi:DNA-binding transcriptional ArsR family regulator